MRRLLPAAAILLFAGCAAPAAGPESDTLAGSPTIETSDVRTLYSAAHWSAIESRTFDGYVVMQGVPESDSTVRIQKVLESVPDHSRDDMAMFFGSRLKAGTQSSGPVFTERIMVYAVFYTGPLGTRTALVFSYQPPDSIYTRSAGRHGEAYVTEYDPASWQLAEGTVSAGNSLSPDYQ
jgi:hypothetical protein